MLLILSSATTGFSADLPTAASWIWYPEPVATEGAGQTRYLRKVIKLDGTPAEVKLRVLADDSYSFWVNGEAAPPPMESGRAGSVFELSSLMRQGENVLAFAVYNAVGKGGLIVTGSVRLAEGGELPIRSDSSFRASRDAPEGWNRPGFDDSSWPAATVVGSALSPPWYRHPAFDMEPFLEGGDRERWEAWRKRVTALPPGLNRERRAHAAFRYVRGSCALVINGTPRPALIYRGTVDPLSVYGRRQIALFRDAGVHVYAADVPLEEFWSQQSAHKPTAVDDLVCGYLSVDPEAYLILLVSLVPPNSWMDAHPDELVRYAQGEDYNTSDECGRVRRPSLASQAWRREALTVWTQAIRHLEARPWGKRVIGYHPCFGIYGEWHYYGSWTEQMPDTGPAMTRHFRAWLRARYQTNERLQKAWGNRNVTFDTAEVPGPEARLTAGPLGLRDPINGRQVMDYYQCQQEVTAEDIELFCQAAKRETRGRVITGVFYGYFNGVPPQTQGGHLELEQLLRSPVIDYFAAPYDYSHRRIGQDGRLRPICDAFPIANKVHMIEDDTRTHLHPRDEHGRAANLDESIAAIRRQVSTALVHGSALWWCDFGADGSGGWYDDPQLMAEIAAMVKLAEGRLKIRRQRTAQVGVVCDLKSCYWLGDGDAMRTHYRLVDRVMTELYGTGAPFDTILLSQLSHADLSRYRLLIFLNTLRVDPQTRRLLTNVIAGRAVLWLWAPGITNGVRFGPELVRELTGFQVALKGDGIPCGTAICERDHALTRRIPLDRRLVLKPREVVPMDAFLRAHNWYNPRDKATMDQQYSCFEWRTEADAFRWAFATTAGWTDIHLDTPIPQCDGLSMDIWGQGNAVGLSLRLVVKGGQGGEFVGPPVAVESGPRTVVFPFVEFRKAPWDLTEATTISFPLRGLKLVVNGVAPGRVGELVVRHLSGVRGELVEEKQRSFGDESMRCPVLTITDGDAMPLARELTTREVVVACKDRGRTTRVFSTLPFVPQELLCALMDEAGVRRYVDAPHTIVRADSSLIALHTSTGGTVRVRLSPSERSWRILDLRPGTTTLLQTGLGSVQ